MYLPQFKYKKAKYTQGFEFQLPNRKPYIGWCFETYKGEYYTGKEPGKNNIKLIQISTNNDSTSLQKIFTPTVITPTQFDISKGFYIRYFLQDKRTKRIVEVDREKYQKFNQLVYIDGLELNWILKKPAENVYKNGYMYEGAASKNQKAVEEIEKKFPWIKTQIKSYDEFVQ